jgi:predicted Zn-dependent protease with MMP-like domain
MEREPFAKVMQEVIDSLPEEFRSRISNVAVLVEEREISLGGDEVPSINTRSPLREIRLSQ